jgi:hypothetical protein
MKKHTRLILLLSALLIGGAASAWFVDTLDAQGIALPAGIGDLSNASTIEVKDSAGTVVLRGNFVEVPEDDDDVERKAELIGAAGATGEAEVEVSKTNNQLDQEVEVSVSKLTPGATYAVFVDGTQLGTFQTNNSGSGELELTTPK